MKRESPDPLSEALSLVRNPASAASPSAREVRRGARGDICELFLAELQSRRERLQDWLRLLDEQVRLEDGRAPARRRRAAASSCRSRRSGREICASSRAAS